MTDSKVSGRRRSGRSRLRPDRPDRSPLRDPKTLAGTDANPDGFQAFLVAVRNETIAFGKPVVYVHGDSHYFRVDKPLLDAAGNRLENFTRVETFGDNAANGLNDVQWVKASLIRAAVTFSPSSLRSCQATPSRTDRLPTVITWLPSD